MATLKLIKETLKLNFKCFKRRKELGDPDHDFMIKLSVPVL